MALNLFEPEEQNIFGGSRKGVAFVKKMMRKTKQRHNGVYRKPPAVPFSYDAKQPEDWSEFIQKKFGPDGADVVKYKRPAPRQKSAEEKEYDKVHRWDYWGLNEDELEYDEAQKKWWIGDTDYSFPPIHWKAPNGQKYWGLPHYESHAKGQHFDKIAFPAEEGKYPETLGEFSQEYARKNNKRYAQHTEDEIEFGGKEYKVLDGVVSHERNWLTRTPRYYAWYSGQDDKSDGWGFDHSRPRRDIPPADEPDEAQKPYAIKQIKSAIKELKSRVRWAGDLNVKYLAQEEKFSDALARAKEAIVRRVASKEYGSGWGFLSRERQQEQIRRVEERLDRGNGEAYNDYVAPMNAGVGGKSIKQMNDRIDENNRRASYVNDIVQSLNEVIDTNIGLLEELGGEGEDANVYSLKLKTDGDFNQYK
jgi:hypothetical protein